MQAEFKGGRMESSFHNSEADAARARLEALSRGAVRATVSATPAVGERITINGLIYKVQDVRSRGRLFLKLLGT